jgi:hypothetical protein
MNQPTFNGLSDQGLQLVPRAPVDLPPEANQELQPAEEPSNPLSGPARVDEVLREKEEFVKSAFLFLQDVIYPATNKVGHALSGFKDKFRKRCAPFRIFRQGDSDVFVRIDPKNPGQPPRRVIWGEERFKAVQALHEGEDHYGGVNKTRSKVANRYWFPQLTKFVNEFVKTCNVCQKERVGAAPRDDREIFRWEGPYIFWGYKDQETKRQAVLEDGKGKKWYRASNQIRRYYPRLNFTNEYLELMKKIDVQVPTGREIEQRFVEQVY